jgi:hypothetical protein
MRKIVPVLSLSAALVSGALLTYPTWAGQPQASPPAVSAESHPHDADAAAAAGWEKIESYDNLKDCLDAGTKGQESGDYELWFCFPSDEEGGGDESTTSAPTSTSGTSSSSTTTSEAPDEGDGFDLWALKTEGAGEGGNP